MVDSLACEVGMTLLELC